MSQPIEPDAAARIDSPIDRFIDHLVPTEVEWRELVRAYPIPCMLAVAGGGFYLGAVHGRRILETVSDLLAQRVEDTTERLRSAVRDRTS